MFKVSMHLCNTIVVVYMGNNNIISYIDGISHDTDTRIDNVGADNATNAICIDSTTTIDID